MSLITLFWYLSLSKLCSYLLELFWIDQDSPRLIILQELRFSFKHLEILAKPHHCARMLRLQFGFFNNKTSKDMGY